jgi:hypothetical protein
VGHLDNIEGLVAALAESTGAVPNWEGGAPTGPYDGTRPTAYGKDHNEGEPLPDFDREDMSHRGGDHRRGPRGRSELFKQNPKPTAAGALTALVDGELVLGGTRDLGTKDDPFVPRTLYINCSGPADDVAVATLGFVTVEIVGQQPGQPWVRRLTIAPGQAVQCKIETFRDVSVKVLHSTALGASLDVVVSEEVSYGSGARDIAYYAVHYVPGNYYRPPGATSFLPGQADGAFAWVCGGPAANITIVDAVVAFTAKVARGPAFTVAAGGLDLIWLVELT